MEVLQAGIPGQTVVAGAQILTNNHTGIIELRASFTADNAGGTAANSAFYPIAGCGSAARATLPAGVTYAGGSFSTYADLQDYLQKAGVVIESVRMSDAGTTNYSNEIATADVMPWNTNIQEKVYQLSDYRENVGSGYSDVINMKDMKFVVLPNTYMKTSILKNTTITFYFKCTFVGAKAFTQVR